MTIERIDATTPALQREGHEFRYRVAAGHVDPEDTVVDFGCGVGYGSAIIRAHRYVGIDVVDVIEDAYRPLGDWYVGDVCEWEYGRLFRRLFDVAVCFECIEHVKEPMKLIEACCEARKYVIASVPIVPTVGINPYHLTDFTFEDLPKMFRQFGWRCMQAVQQPSELSAIYVFCRDGSK